MTTKLDAADQGDIPGPLVERGDTLMNGGQTAAALDETLECLLLSIVEYLARAVEEHDRSVASEVCRRERAGVFRRVDGEATVDRDRADSRDPGGDRVVAIRRRLGEDEYPRCRRLGVGLGNGELARHYTDCEYDHTAARYGEEDLYCRHHIEKPSRSRRRGRRTIDDLEPPTPRV